MIFISYSLWRSVSTSLYISHSSSHLQIINHQWHTSFDPTTLRRQAEQALSSPFLREANKLRGCKCHFPQVSQVEQNKARTKTRSPYWWFCIWRHPSSWWVPLSLHSSWQLKGVLDIREWQRGQQDFLLLKNPSGSFQLLNPMANPMP